MAAETVQNIALVLMGQKKFDAALKKFKEALSIKEELRGEKRIVWILQVSARVRQNQ